MTLSFTGKDLAEIKTQLVAALQGMGEISPVIATHQEATRKPAQTVESVFVFDYEHQFDSWIDVFHALKLVSSTGQVRKNLPVNRQHCDDEEDFNFQLRKWLRGNTPLQVDRVKVKPSECITASDSEIDAKAIDIYSL